MDQRIPVGISIDEGRKIWDGLFKFLLNGFKFKIYPKCLQKFNAKFV